MEDAVEVDGEGWGVAFHVSGIAIWGRLFSAKISGTRSRKSFVSPCAEKYANWIQPVMRERMVGSVGEGGGEWAAGGGGGGVNVGGVVVSGETVMSGVWVVD